tara:strand:- start:536 stop:967 length:432 start_codon:yes stop_codon:yes gene_type:complete
MEILLILLVSLVSSNLVLMQQNFILSSLTKEEYYCVKNILIFLFVMIYMIFINKGEIYKKIQKIENNRWKYILLDSVLTIFNVLLWYYLLQNTDAHKLVSYVNPLTILFTLILSYLIYKKNISTQEIIGIMIVLLGLIIINKK